MAATQQAGAKKTALEVAMAAYLANTTRAATLAAGATHEQANVEAEKAIAEALGGPHPAHKTT